MCGIVAIHTKEFNFDTIMLYQALLRQSQIRGKHATGVSTSCDGKLQTFIQPLSAEEFLDSTVMSFAHGKAVSIIGHCRYSTSDLEYNQPISTEENSIAHNGVITQRLPENWEKAYGYKCEGKNDSELALRAIEAGKHPLHEFPHSSIALVHLNNSGEVNFYRNGTRPLWFCGWQGHWIVASTADILNRTFKSMQLMPVLAQKCEPGFNYKFKEMKLYKELLSGFSGEDKQKPAQCANYYLKHGLQSTANDN